jgi:DNA-binding IclR family transcriptional regulator
VKKDRNGVPDLKQRYIIPSLDRAFQVLDLLAREPDGQTLAELSRRTSIPKSTLFRIMATLQLHHCVQWVAEEGCYRLGHYIWELGRGFVDQCQPYRIAEGHMKRLSETTGETVFMARLEGSIVVYLRRVDGTKAVAMMRNLGQSTPVFCTATGRAILAFLPEEDVDAVFDGEEIIAWTETTITDRTALKQCLAQVRRQGYAVVDSEYNRELLCISAPVFDHHDRPCAALTLAMLSSQRMQTGLIQQYAILVRESADAFSRDLGSHGREGRFAPTPCVEAGAGSTLNPSTCLTQISIIKESAV